MDNEILENGSAPENEEIQETVAVEETATVEETVVPEETATVEETVVPEETAEAAPQEAKKSFTDVLSNVADKGKALIEDPKPLLDKIKSVSKKVWMMIGGGVAALIAIIIVLSLLGNTYKTPIKAAEKLLSSKSVNQVLNRVPALLNGFGEDEAETLIRIAKKSDTYKENVGDIEEMFEQVIEGLEENLGSNYKIKLKVTDKEKLEKDDVKAFRDQLRKIGKMEKQLDEADADFIEDVADETGLSKAQVKKAIRTAEDFCEDCKEAKVKKGYELTVEVKITGSELDEPTELEIPVNVFKVDGRWVPDVFSLAENAMSLVMGGVMGGLGDMSDLLGGF